MPSSLLQGRTDYIFKVLDQEDANTDVQVVLEEPWTFYLRYQACCSDFATNGDRSASSVSLFRTVERCPPVCKYTQTHTRSCSAARYYATTTDDMTFEWELSMSKWNSSLSEWKTTCWVAGFHVRSWQVASSLIHECKSLSVCLSLSPSNHLSFCLTICVPYLQPL